MEAEFQQIIDKYHPILYKIGRSYTQSEADFQDLYQEMLIQLWRAFPRFRAEAKLSTFIYRVVLNTALTYQRKHARSRTLSLDTTERQWADHSPTEQALGQQREARTALLYRCINQLNKRDRALILLHLDGKSYAEMAEIMGLSVSNIGVRLLRCKKKLHHLLTAAGYARI